MPVRCLRPARPASRRADGRAGRRAHPVRDIDVTTLKADLVDVRTPDAFAAGHLPGAKNLPLGDLEDRISELGATDAEVTVVCEVGGRSGRAAATLATRGFRAVNVLGGTSGWRAAGFPPE